MPDTPQQAYCLYCGKPVKGRIDKKFCDDWCRNAYNNKRYSQHSGFVRNVNTILRKTGRYWKNSFPTGKK